MTNRDSWCVRSVGTTSDGLHWIETARADVPVSFLHAFVRAAAPVLPGELERHPGTVSVARSVEYVRQRGNVVWVWNLGPVVTETAGGRRLARFVADPVSAAVRPAMMGRLGGGDPVRVPSAIVREVVGLVAECPFPVGHVSYGEPRPPERRRYVVPVRAPAGPGRP